MNRSVHSDVKLEMNGISELDNDEYLKKAEPIEEIKEELVKSALRRKEEEMKSLKKKLLFKEKIIQAEVLEKKTAKSRLRKLCLS